MTELSGWLDLPWTSADAQQRLQQAAERSRALGRDPTKTLINDGVAVCATFQTTLAPARDDRYTAAIVGHPRPATSQAHAIFTQHDPQHALLPLVYAFGEDLPRHLDGGFTLAILDRQARSVFLAIDRAGINSLYVTRQDQGLAFASSAATLQALLAKRSDISLQGIFNYLYFHMVPSPGTIYAGVDKLLPGQYLRFARGEPKTGFYWTMPYTPEHTADFPTLREQFRAIVERAVERATTASPTGAFLSGGTDSSTVAGTLRAQHGTAVDTFAIGFDAEGFDEMAYARLAAEHFQTRLHAHYVSPEEVVAAIPLLSRHSDEPVGNASAIPAYYCAKMAKEAGMALLLGGDGGDELFAGNERYRKQLVFERYFAVPAPLRRYLLKPVVFQAARLGFIPLAGKARSYIEQAEVPLPARLETYNFLQRSPLAEIFTADFLAAIDPGEPLANLTEVYQRTASAQVIDRMLHLDLKITLADNDLRKVNLPCELAGVAVHYPLLDQEMLHFAAGLPPHLLLRKQQLRWFFKAALADFLPAAIIHKTKHGFGLPFGLWLQSHRGLYELAHDSLAQLRRRGYLKPAYLDWLERQHRQAHASYYGVMLWVLMMLEQWLSAHEA